MESSSFCRQTCEPEQQAIESVIVLKVFMRIRKLPNGRVAARRLGLPSGTLRTFSTQNDCTL